MTYYLRIIVTFFFVLTGDVVMADSDPSNGELRCDELGANCICAEALNTSDVPFVGLYYMNPADSTSNECNQEGQAGSPFAVNPRDGNVLPRNDAAALAALPAGHTVTYFYGENSPSPTKVWLGGWNDLANLPARATGPYVKRAAARFYVYFSPDFEFKFEGACQNSKFMKIDSQPVDQYDPSGGLHQYNFLGDTILYNNATQTVGDCCIDGPPVGVSGYTNTNNALKGKWHRFEYVITNRAGGASPNGLHFELFWRNITDGTPEVQVLDNQVACPLCRPSGGAMGFDDWTPSNNIDRIWLNFYRQGTCNGYHGVSHMLWAGWDTDTGQRIGSAAEIEGVSGEINPGPDFVRPLPPNPLE